MGTINKSSIDMGLCRDCSRHLFPHSLLKREGFGGFCQGICGFLTGKQLTLRTHAVRRMAT